MARIGSGRGPGLRHYHLCDLAAVVECREGLWVLDTGATPDVTYTPDGPTDADVQDLAGNALGSTESWWNASWLNRTQITFDNSARADNLIDFPVLVSLTSSEVDFAKIKAGGADIRFIDRTTGAELNYQIENWDDGAETATVWVKIPQIDGSSDTDFIWMYYHNPGASDNSGTAVWNAGYEGVWHLNEATDATNVDATINTNDGTPRLSPAAATGKIPLAPKPCMPRPIIKVS